MVSSYLDYILPPLHLYAFLLQVFERTIHYILFIAIELITEDTSTTEDQPLQSSLARSPEEVQESLTKLEEDVLADAAGIFLIIMIADYSCSDNSSHMQYSCKLWPQYSMKLLLHVPSDVQKQSRVMSRPRKRLLCTQLF